MIDASEHLLLINRVIGQMGITGDEAEEAYSESLVSITRAAQTYDSTKNVPLASWLAINIRYGILTWRNKQRLCIPLNMPIVDVSGIPEVGITFKETISSLDSLLTPFEKQVILATAFGYTGREIAKALDTYPVAISRAKKRAREKLQALR